MIDAVAAGWAGDGGAWRLLAGLAFTTYVALMAWRYVKRRRQHARHDGR